MNSRVSRWMVFLVSGGYGWYQNIVAMGWAEKWLSDWLSVILFFVAIGSGYWSANHVANELETKARKLVDGWWKEAHYARRCQKREKAIKWMLVPVLIWMLPLLLGLFGLAGAGHN